MRKMDTVCFDRFLHCAMLRIAPVEMTERGMLRIPFGFAQG